MSATARIEDLLDVDSLLAPEEIELRQTVRRFGEQRLRPYIAEWFEAGEVPVRELAADFGKLGLLGMHLQGYGCGGSTATAYGVVCQELEAVDSGVRSMVSVQGSLAMFAIHRHGSEEQRKQWLPAMATGDVIGCFGLTEPDFGSNPAGMRTTARRDGSDWILNGSKMWITNGSIADVAIVWARAEEGIVGFVVPTGTPGFTARDMTHKLSLRASITSELSLDDVRLPAEAKLPEARGLAGPLACLSEARFGIVFGSVGAARDCLQTTLDYVGTREVFDKPLAGYQLTQAKLADMAVELSKAQLLALHLGRLKDNGRI
ncbi:MAG: acyl-CoA dehydrogenase family protein, partial [Mycobacterium sp.]